ncbi:MAG TPA: hypothetical protein VGJ33_09620 [Candidatus Angelobacter sp.]|jgi:hypothetical protein
MSEIKQDVYKTIFETWRYQSDAYWQRSNYFLAVETAGLGGCWYILEHSHLRTGLAFSLIGLISAVAWLVTSVAFHRYVDYWWEAIKTAEAANSLKVSGLDFVSKHPGSRLHPSRWMYLVPVLFFFAWIVVLAFSLHCLRSGCKLTP